MTSNTNILSMALVHQNVMSYNVTYMAPVDGNPIPVGEIYTTFPNLMAEKDDIICLAYNAFCDSTTTSTDTIQCDFEMLLGFFVDNILIEERIISHSGNEIKQITWDGSGLIGGTAPITDEDILDKTINFIVP